MYIVYIIYIYVLVGGPSLPLRWGPKNLYDY